MGSPWRNPQFPYYKPQTGWDSNERIGGKYLNPAPGFNSVVGAIIEASSDILQASLDVLSAFGNFLVGHPTTNTTRYTHVLRSRRVRRDINC